MSTEELSEEEEYALKPGANVIPMHDGAQLRWGDAEIQRVRFPHPSLLCALLNPLVSGCSRKRLVELAAADQEVGERSEALEIVEELLERLRQFHLLRPTSVPRKLGENRFQGEACASSPQPVSLIYSAESSPPLAPFGDSRLAARLVARDEPLRCERAASDSFGLEPLNVVWLERHDEEFAARVNRHVTRKTISTLFVDLSHGGFATIGPFYVRGEGACRACYRRRTLETADAAEELLAAREWSFRRKEPLNAYGCLPHQRHWIGAMVVAELLAFLGRSRPLRTLNGLLLVDFDAMAVHREPCWQIPWCEDCGSRRSAGESL